MTGEVEPADLAHSVAMDVVLEHYAPDEIDDLDISATYEGGDLTIDVYLLVAGEDTADVVTEAIERAVDAVDELMAED